MNDVFHLEPGEKVCCHYCQRQGDHTEYERGDAFLAWPGHSPYNQDANYVCRKHLYEDDVIYEPTYPGNPPS